MAFFDYQEKPKEHNLRKPFELIEIEFCLKMNEYLGGDWLIREFCDSYICLARRGTEEKSYLNFSQVEYVRIYQGQEWTLYYHHRDSDTLCAPNLIKCQ